MRTAWHTLWWEVLCKNRTLFLTLVGLHGLAALTAFDPLRLNGGTRWPNLIERLVVISSTEEINPALVAQQLGKAAVPSPTQEEGSRDQALYSYEKNLILQALIQSGGIKNQAAKLLGIRTSTLYYKMEKYGILK